MSKIIYTAGAMEMHEGTTIAEGWRNKVKEYFNFIDDGFVVISPTDFYEYGKNYHKTEKEVMRFDLRKVQSADVILVNLNNVRQSIGTNDEILYAYLNGKPVIGFIDEELNKKELSIKIHPWKYEQCDRVETGRDGLRKAMDYIRDFYGEGNK